MNLDSFLDRLPRCPGPAAFPLQARSSGAVSYPDHLEEFVAPDVAVRPDIDASPHNSVIIISAAGAVGKSTLARELAHARGAPLWDLSLSGPVGQHSLQGMLAAEFGVASVGQVYAALQSGSLFLVIDALDEARVKVTEGAFEAFIADIAALVGTSTSVRAVLLGRTQVAETTWLLLSEAGVDAALYTIEPFSRPQAEEYIRRRIERIGGSAAARMSEHANPFAQARDLIITNLRSAIVGSPGHEPAPDADAFIGYAPVLDAISILLAHETNFGELINRLRDDEQTAASVGSNGHIALLGRIVERILAREQADKLVRNLKPVLEGAAQQHGWSRWDVLYAPDEQCDRLIRHVLGQPAPTTVGVPQALRARYEEQLQTFLPEHPFLRDGRTPANLVFESYLYCRALRQADSTCRAMVEARVGSLEYKPSRLLADFYLSHARSSDTTTVPASHVGILYESLVSAETGSIRVHLSLDGLDPSDSTSGSDSSAEGELEIRLTDDADGGARVLGTMTFVTPLDGSAQILFPRILRDATIVVPCTVVLGAGAADFSIGPRVHINCGSLSINALTLVVEGAAPKHSSTDEETGVRLEARRFQGAVSRPPVVRGELHVSWPGAEAHPWTAWRSDGLDLGAGDNHMAVAYRRFRRIVMTLRSHSKGRLARYRGKIEHQRVLQGPMGKCLLDKLVSDGILTLEGKFFFWAPETAGAKVGVSWQDLKNGAAGDRLRNYLRAFITAHPEHFPG